MLGIDEIRGMTGSIPSIDGVPAAIQDWPRPECGGTDTPNV